MIAAAMAHRPLRGLMMTWHSLSAPKRFLVRVLLMLATLITIAVMSAQPALAASVDVDTLSVDDWSDDLSRYLIVNRWSAISFAPTGYLGLGSIVTNGTYMIQNMLVALAVFIARIFMGIVSLSSGGGLVSGTANLIDSVFAKVGNGVLGNDGGSLLSGRGAFTVAVLLLVLFAIAAWRFVRGGYRAATMTLFGGLGALAALLILSSGAAHNAAQVKVAAGGSYANTKELTNGGAVASPQWVISHGNALSAWVGDFTERLLTSMTNSLKTDDATNANECTRYIDAIHETYLEKAGDKQATAGHVMVAMDELLTTVLWDGVRVSSLGGETSSSDSAWCRYSEMDANAPVIDQVQLSRKAGLYSDIVGYDPSIVIDSSWSSKSRDGSAVSANGTWVDEDLAASIFGPTFSSGDTSSRAMYYWAACQWDTPGGTVKVNPAWADVRASAATDQSVMDSVKQNGGWVALVPAAGLTAAIVDYFSNNSGHYLGDKDYNACAQVVKTGLVVDDKDGANAFQYGESYFLQDTLRWWNLSAQDFFSKPVQAGNTEAINFYRATQGLDTVNAALGSTAAVLASGIFVWLAAPTAVGLLAAQVIGVIAWMLLPVALLCLIVPTQKTKMVAAMAGKTILFSMFAAIIFQFVIQFALFTYTLVNSLFVTPTSGGMSRYVMSTLAAVLSFWLVKKVVKSVFTSDITTLRGAMRASTQIANRPLMSQRGDLDDNYGFKQPGFMKRTASYVATDAINQGRRRLGSTLLNRGRGDGAEDSIIKDQTAQKPTTDEAAATAATAATQPKPSRGSWRTATGGADAAATAATALGVAGGAAKPVGAQARGRYAVDPASGTFTIPKDGTISAVGGFPDESTVMARSISAQERAALAPKDRRAYTFDPVTGRFVEKLGIAGLSAQGVSRDVVAPLSALTSATAPDGVLQADWDKTLAMRSQIQAAGLLASAAVTRSSLFAESAERAREVAAAAGHHIPEAPTDGALAQQAPGITSAANQGSSAVVMQRHPSGSPKVTVEGDSLSRLTRSEYDESGRLERRVYERDGQSVERTYDPASGQRLSETWRNADGQEHRLDGPARTTYTASGDVASREWHVAGQAMSQETFDLAMRAAREAVQSAGVAGGAAIDTAALAEAMSLASARLSGAALNPAVLESLVASAAARGRDPYTDAISGLSTLDSARQQAIAHEAARAVMENVDLYASLTKSTPERVSSAAQSVLDGSVNPQMLEALVRMVNESSVNSQHVAQMRQELLSAVSELSAANAQSAVAGGGLAAVPVLMGLDAAQQRVLAEEAARMVAQSPDVYGDISRSYGLDLASEAKAVLEGRDAANERIIQAVREAGQGREADEFRSVIDAISMPTSAMGSIDAQMRQVADHVAHVADTMRGERTTAIRDRLERDLLQMREQADAEIREINASLADAMRSDDSGIAGIQRNAFIRKTQIEERLAAQMSAALDSVGIELSNANVGDDYIAPLRASREAMLKDFSRVRGIRGWFQH